MGVEFHKPVVEFCTNWYLPQFEHFSYFDSTLQVAKITEQWHVPDICTWIHSDAILKNMICVVKKGAMADDGI